MTTTVASPPTTATPAPAPPPARHAPRRDIQGLRALAVLGVIADHLLGWPHGGFVGVDVFFVLSGFLITDLLLRERQRTGRISILGFYRRRVKRILPAAALVLVTTVVASYPFFSPTRWRETVADAVWATGFAANWRFGTQGTDYFNADRPVSPLQHFWSLAVEEQFYVVWPTLVILVASVVLARRGSLRSLRLVLTVVTAVVAVVSFAWALRETAGDPHLAYFSTFSRAWELAAGALLAVAAPRVVRLPRILSGALAWAGTLGILAAYAVIGEDLAFPAPWAALPVLATVAVLVAGSSSTPHAPWLLTNRVSGYLGDISYSLYLWHFPVIIVGISVLGSGTAATLALGAGILVLSVYSYELVENPLRTASWTWRRSPGTRGVRSRRVRSVAVTLPATAVVLVLAAIATSTGQPVSTVPVSAADAATTATLTPAEAARQSDVVTALETTEWPDLSPSMDDAIGSAQAPPDVVRCGASATPVDVETCTFGAATAPEHAVVVGDSVSLTYVNPLRLALDEVAGPDQWQITTLGTFGCPFVDLSLGQTEDTVEECASRRVEAVRAIRELDPDVLFVSHSADTPSVFGTGDTVSEPEWRAALTRMLQRVASPDMRVVFLSPPPGDKDVEECYTPLSGPNDCVGTVSAEWQDRAESEQQLATDFGGSWVDASPWFCVNGYCPSFVDGVPVRSDSVHMTVAYGESIAPLLAASMRASIPWLTAAGRTGGTGAAAVTTTP